jgi:cell wall-associated NlpC family hydrolase
MGIPEFTTAPKPFFQRIFAEEKEIYLPNTSYVQRGVLYLTPGDMNFFMAARKAKDTSNNAS